MRRQGGFTLVEVIISLILVSLLLLALVSSLRSFGDASVRVDQRALTLDELRIAPGFLERVIGSSTSRARTDPTAGGVTWFQGTQTELEWLGIMPARHGVGGMSHFRLSQQDWYGRPSLVLQIAPFISDDVAPDWTQFEPEAVAENVVELSFSYLPATGGEWVSEWPAQQYQPGWVGLEVVTTAGAWPLLAFRIRDVSLSTVEGTQ